MIFNTLLEFDNYIPNCIICNKRMQISLEGFLKADINRTESVHSFQKRRSRIKLLFTLKDHLFHSCFKNKTVICINSFTNKVLEGSDIISNIEFPNGFFNDLYLNKRCSTCHFKIKTFRSKIDVKNILSSFHLHSEEIHYTLRKGIDVKICKYYSPIKSGSTIISLNKKILPDIPFDFSKFNDLNHLNKRIATIKLFH